MDPDKAKRRQSLRVIVSEAIMVIAVVMTVVVLAFMVSGYWLNSDFKVERQGLLQISSIPTGADIYTDGSSSWLQRTNTSKVLPVGEHTISLSKEGYDSWSKTINISEGLLYRIHYPRLFPTDRTPENMLDVSGTTLVSASPDHNLFLLINDTTEWSLINLDSDTVTPTKIDVADLFSSVSLAEGAEKGLFTGRILDISWDYNASHALFEVATDAGKEWVLLDVKNPDKSINLNKEFGSSNFSEIQILDNSSNNLLAIQDGNLHKIDLGNKSLSAVLVENVNYFDHYNSNEIIFSATDSSLEAPSYYVGIIKIGDSKVTELKTTFTPAKVVMSKFYDDKYITILEDNVATLYKREDFSEISSFELSFTPDTIEVGHSGEFITMTKGTQIATLDMESASVLDWSIDSENFGWLDNDMFYSVAEGELIVYDYDGLNRRSVAKNVASHFPAAITSDKWLYYFSDNYLVRESLDK